MEAILKTIIGYPDQIPQTLLSYVLVVGFFLLFDRLVDSVIRYIKKRNDRKRAGGEKVSDRDFVQKP